MTPNWQHNSGKGQKPTRRPQALRDARRRRQALKAALGLIPGPGHFSRDMKKGEA